MAAMKELWARTLDRWKQGGAYGKEQALAGLEAAGFDPVEAKRQLVGAIDIYWEMDMLKYQTTGTILVEPSGSSGYPMWLHAVANADKTVTPQGVVILKPEKYLAIGPVRREYDKYLAQRRMF